MPLGKQAEVLTKAQGDRVLRQVESTHHPVRNRAIILFIANTAGFLIIETGSGFR